MDMALDRIDGPGSPQVPAPAAGAGSSAGTDKVSAGAGGKSFGDILLESIQEADRLQGSADAAIQELAAGRRDDVAGVMTAVEKADLAFRTLMGVRNKLVDAYDELMRLRI
jgi:flagellar hook-basal body complex protein FliE